jgi:predicted RNA-binding protein with PUA-like domain
MNPPRYWLLKTEPEVFSFADLSAAPDQTTLWEGVRNYQARNFLREMRCGDGVLIYHSNARPAAVAGLAEVVREAFPDPTQFDPESPYFDPRASRERPRWVAVEVRASRPLPHPVTLHALRAEPALSDLPLVRRGNRLSVMPVRLPELEAILKLAGVSAPNLAIAERSPA